MQITINGTERRKQLLSIIRNASKPVSGTALGKETGVSRQVIVQDIALLRTEGYPIVATARGYLLNEPRQAVRLFKVHHTNEQTEEELTSIVDLGGSVLDVMVNHRIYGKMSAPLNIRNRRDIQVFMHNLKSGKSTPLLNVTSGYHFHHVAADQEEILDEVQDVLKSKGFLAELLSYEKESLK